MLGSPYFPLNAALASRAQLSAITHFRKTGNDEHQAVEELGGVELARRRHLREKVRRPLNGTRDQVREQADEESILHQRAGGAQFS
jgi:hypothetical protein